MKKIILLVSCIVLILTTVKAQGFLHANGKNIVNGNGDNVILRGIGTGNWMIMEGYMMKTEGVAGTQHEFRAKLEETIGVAKTDSFFNVWLQNHMTRTDVDSMKVWGFNSVRVAMHYKWFTPPIEEEPVAGEITWINKGFVMIDSLLDWCADNKMYLILDLHGAPGGQGANADISDYDPTKPSLWESSANKAKTVALWYKLAQRYSNEQWIGGYDLINETNWTFPEGNNSQMRDLFGRITDTIRLVDNNHIIFIEGNSFANDHSDLTPPWDDNMAYSFHKYWSGTGPKDLEWITSLRDTYNVPLWLGESGENSNTWYTDMIHLSESNNIGWSWWPVKKEGINNVLKVPINDDYSNLIKYWKGEITTAPSIDEAFQAVLTWAENHKIENCTVMYDVIDAMIRQPHSDEVLPFKTHKLTEPIYFSDFDYGKNTIAYNDTYIANYGGEWTGWNNGWALRNDGVDIEVCQDATELTNGYNVGWTDDGEWMQYSLNSDSVAAYTLNIRHASGSAGSKVHFEVNGVVVSETLTLPGTGGWQEWQTNTFENIIIPAGPIKIKFVFDQGGSNISFFNFINPQSTENIEFKFMAAETSTDGSEIYVDLNKEVTTAEADIVISEFKLLADLEPINITSISKQASSTVLVLKVDKPLYFDNAITLSYAGASILSGNQTLTAFSNKMVKNNLPLSHIIPGKIQAEEFYENNGFALEVCEDTGGGQNTGYTQTGDYLTYNVHVTQSAFYTLNYRVATEKSNAEVIFMTGDGTNYTAIDTIRFSSTGGWQKWETQSSKIYLDEGYYFIKLLIKQGEHNLNWFQLDIWDNIKENNSVDNSKIYPNPARESLTIDLNNNKKAQIYFYNIMGELTYTRQLSQSKETVFINHLSKGIYLLKIESAGIIQCKKLIIE